MRLIRWKRIGQSGQELAAAILFSFIIHGLLITAALVYNFAASPKISIPISYQVALVSAPTAVGPALPQEASPPPPKPEEVPAQKKTASKAPAAAKPPAAAKSTMPDLGAPKAAKKKIEQQPEATTDKEKPAAPSGPTSPVGVSKEAVTVSAVQQNLLPGLSGYLPSVTRNIKSVWDLQVPAGVREVRSKVMFRILRSGRKGEVKLLESSGNFYFDQAAIRTVLLSTFPQLPDEYPREYVDISVDLIPKD